MNNANNTPERNVLFTIYDFKGTVVRDVYGPTKEQLNKSKPVNCCITGAFYILQEERSKLKDIEKKYREVWKKDIKDIREKIIKRIRSETNWKLRVLNEQLRKKIKEEKIMEAAKIKQEEVMEAAEALIKLSKSAERSIARKANKKKREEQQQQQPARRSSRIAKIEMEKMRNSCRGCREDQPNQLAHVGPGGCLGEEEF